MKRILCFYLCFSGTFLLSSGQTPTLRVQLGHSDWISDVAFSSDGNFLITASDDKTLKIWETNQWRLLRTLEGHRAKINTIALNADEETIISADARGEIIFWNLNDGLKLKQVDIGEEEIIQLYFVPQTNVLLVITDEKEIIALDTEKNTIIWQVTETYQPLCIAVSKDNKIIVTGAENGTFAFRNWHDGKKRREIEAHIGAIQDVLITPENQIITAGKDKRIRMWDKNGEPLDDFQGSKSAITDLAISEDGQKLASASEDKTFRLWDIPTKTLIRVTEAHTFAVTCVAFSPDGRFVVSGSEDNTAKIWENSTGELVGVVGLNRNFALAIQFDEQGEKLVIGNRSRVVQVLHFESGRIINTWGGHQNSVTTLVQSKNGWITGSTDGSVIVRQLSGEPLFTLATTSKEINGLAWLSGKIGATSQNKLFLWNEKGQLIRQIEGRNGYLRALQAHSEARRWALASGELRTEAGIHNLVLLTEKGEIAQTIIAHKGIINQIQFSPSGMYVATASYDKTAKIWETATGKLIRQFIGHTEAVYCLAFHPGGQILATGSFDKTIRIWDIPSQKLLATLQGNEGWIWALAFSPDGKYLVSSSTDTKLKVWETSTWKEKLSFILLNNNIDYVITTPEGIFDGTQAGIQHALHFTDNNTVIPLSSLYEKYYFPGLWQRIFRNEKLFVHPYASGMLPAPEVRFLLPDMQTRGFKPSTPLLKVSSERFVGVLQVVDKGGGIDEMRLFQNGKLVVSMPRNCFHKTIQDNVYQVEFEVTLANGINVLSATALNSQRTESLPTLLHVQYESASTVPQADLYLLVVGVNEYKNPRYNLNFAQKDGQAIARAFSTSARGIFKQIYIQEYYNQEATAENIRKYFERLILQAKLEDVFVLYFAGHGVMSSEDENGVFYLCMYETTQLYGAPQELEKYSISAVELQRFSTRLKAQKQLFLIDACQSGGMMQAFSKRSVAEEKAIVQLARATGLAIIAASGQAQYASEVQSLGHGIFTYSVLEGLKGAADGGVKDGKITVGEIKNFASDLVPELSLKYKGTPQYLTVFMSGQDFPIGIAQP
ncbi:MAG: caspase family protein [Cytophagales bacterium]|nr:caspase family protein [Cytophagales bacterium]MDW8383434.1 caspase family protein [Flammeovirgaceae bacterium]